MVQGPGVATTGTRAAADEGGEDRSGAGGSGEAAAPADTGWGLKHRLGVNS